MQHLRRVCTTSKPLFSLASVYCDLAASRKSQAAAALGSRPFITSSSWLGASQQASSGWAHNVLPGPDGRHHWATDPAHAVACHISSRGLASQSASRLKQSVTRAKRIAQQQHGGRSPLCKHHKVRQLTYRCACFYTVAKRQ